jgi:hypothetical protein
VSGPNPEEAADWERHGYANMKPRDDLGLRMIAAWNNTTVEAMPNHPTFRSYPNSSAEAAWLRVAEAARVGYVRCGGV